MSSHRSGPGRHAQSRVGGLSRCVCSAASAWAVGTHRGGPRRVDDAAFMSPRTSVRSFSSFWCAPKSPLVGPLCSRSPSTTRPRPFWRLSARAWLGRMSSCYGPKCQSQQTVAEAQANLQRLEAKARVHPRACFRLRFCLFFDVCVCVVCVGWANARKRCVCVCARSLPKSTYTHEPCGRCVRIRMRSLLAQPSAPVKGAAPHASSLAW